MSLHTCPYHTQVDLIWPVGPFKDHTVYCVKTTLRNYLIGSFTYLFSISEIIWKICSYGAKVLKEALRSSNEGPMKIQYKCLVPIYVFPK